MPERSELRVAKLTDTGRVRDQNEDAVMADPPLVAVADGMGGHVGGEVAAGIALEVLGGFRDRLEGQSAQQAIETLREAFEAANAAVHEKGDEDESVAGMGTTLTAAWLSDDDTLAIAHVGDSRMYLLRRGTLKQLTEDQNVAQELVRRGKLSEEELERSPHRHYLLQAIGAVDGDLDVAVSTVKVKPGDRLVLATDGLYGMVHESSRIAQILNDNPDPDAACRALVDAANAGGGQDNISVVIVDFPGDPGAADDEEDDVVVAGAPAARVPAEPDTKRRASRNWLVGAGAVLLLAIMAVLFLARPTGPNYVVSTRGGNVVVLDGKVGDRATPATGDIVHTFHDEKIAEFPETFQDELRSGYAVESIAAAEQLVDDLPRRRTVATPTPKPTATARPTPRPTRTPAATP